MAAVLSHPPKDERIVTEQVSGILPVSFCKPLRE
jgi:hypothetical protein